MTKLEKMLKEYRQALDEQQALEKEITQLRDDLAKLEKEAELAAQTGDISSYREKKAAVNDLSDTIFVREMQLKKMNPVKTQQEAEEAWNEYAEIYNRNFAKAWKAYDQARMDLFKEYMDLVNGQNEALQIRKKCGACIGIDDSKTHQLNDMFKMDMIPNGMPTDLRAPFLALRTPDTDFFRLLKLTMKEDTITLLNNVVRIHRPI